MPIKVRINPLTGKPDLTGVDALEAPMKIDQNVEVLTENKTLTVSDNPFQVLDPGGASRDVELPAEASSEGLVFYCINAADGGGENLVLKNDGAATITTLCPGMGGFLACDGTDWRAVNFLPAGTLFVDNVSGSVGIGTENPQTLNEIYGSSPRIRISDSRDSYWAENSTLGGIEFYTADLNEARVAASILHITDFPGGHSTPRGAIQFNVSEIGAVFEAVRISSNGNVGIGTTGPLARTDIKCASNGGSTDGLIVRDSDDAELFTVDSDGNAWVLSDVSAAAFTDRTPFFSGDALAEIAAIQEKDGEIDHTTLPFFAQRTIKRLKKQLVTGPRISVTEADAFEPVDITETVVKKDDDGKPIVLSVKPKYEIVDGKVENVGEAELETEERVIGTEKRLKEGVILDPDTGELYTQDESIDETVETVPGRDLGAMVSILTTAVQQLTAKVASLEAAAVKEL